MTFGGSRQQSSLHSLKHLNGPVYDRFFELTHFRVQLHEHPVSENFKHIAYALVIKAVNVDIVKVTQVTQGYR